MIAPALSRTSTPVNRHKLLLRTSQRGATLLQYVILVGCIAVPALAAYAAVGPKLAENYVKVALSVMGIEEGQGE